MKAIPAIVCRWPELPKLPPPGQPVLIHVATAASRPVARQELRNVLRQILVAWSDLLPEQLPLLETSHGPAWSGRLAGYDLDISLSYADGVGWIGFFRSGQIGIDAMSIQTVPEAGELARHYFAPDAMNTVRQSANPALAFAAAWTGLEARHKCLKTGLSEWPAIPTHLATACHTECFTFPARQMLTVATISNAPFTATGVLDISAPARI